MMKLKSQNLPYENMYQLCKKFKNFTTNLIRKREYIQREVDECRNDSKKLRRLLSTIVLTKSSKKRLNLEDGSILTSDELNINDVILSMNRLT